MISFSRILVIIRIISSIIIIVVVIITTWVGRLPIDMHLKVCNHGAPNRAIARCVDPSFWKDWIVAISPGMRASSVAYVAGTPNCAEDCNPATRRTGLCDHAWKSH